jgi:hypothetical protein
MIASRPGLLVLPVALACVCWLGCLALDSLQFSPVDPCVEEAGAVVASYGPRYMEAQARLRKAPPGSPEAQRIRQECQELIRQEMAEVREVYRRHGRERPSRFPGELGAGISRLP